VIAFRFLHDLVISEKIWNVFRGGEVLFTEDAFAEKAAKVKAAKIFSRSSYDSVCQKYKHSISSDLLLLEIKKREILIQKKSAFEYSDEDIDEIKKLVLSGNIEKDRIARTRLCGRAKS
jgi:sulfatase maturation enzyme AslB (radical SAM superfamily)